MAALNSKAVGQRIATLRRQGAGNRSRQAFGAFLDADAATVARWERGEDLDGPTCVRIAERLRVDPHWLMYGPPPGRLSPVEAKQFVDEIEALVLKPRRRR